MRWRLFFEGVRRTITLSGTGVLLIGGLGLKQVAVFAEGATVGISGVLAGAMALSCLMGLTPETTLRQREIVQLPVSRRDIWVVKWWLAVAVPAMIVTAANVIGIAIARFFHQTFLAGRDVALIAACAVLWSGLTMISWPSQWPGLKRLDQLPANSAARKLTARVMIAAVIAWFAAGLGLPFLLAPSIARAAHSPSAWSYTLAAGLALLILSRYFHTPPIKERPSAVRAPRRDVANAPPAAAAPQADSALTGLRFMYWRDARRSLLLVSIMLAGVVGYWWLFESGHRAVGADITTQTLAGFLRAYWLLPFAGRGSEPPIVPIMLIVFTLSSGDDIQREIRRLRTLPLSSWTLSQALCLRALMPAMVLWAGGILLHILVLHALPASLRLGAMALLLGGVAAFHAISLAAAGRKMAGMFVYVTLGMASVNLFARWPLPEGTWAGLGFAALAASLWISEWVIRRRSRLYAKYAGPLAAVESRFN
jgi:hypothetical protein